MLAPHPYTSAAEPRLRQIKRNRMFRICGVTTAGPGAGLPSIIFRGIDLPSVFSPRADHVHALSPDAACHLRDDPRTGVTMTAALTAFGILH